MCMIFRIKLLCGSSLNVDLIGLKNFFFFFFFFFSNDIITKITPTNLFKNHVISRATFLLVTFLLVISTRAKFRL